MKDCNEMEFCPKKCMHIRRFDDVKFSEKQIENPYLVIKPSNSKVNKVSTFVDYVKVPDEQKDIFVILLLIALLVYMIKA